MSGRTACWYQRELVSYQVCALETDDVSDDKLKRDLEQDYGDHAIGDSDRLCKAFEVAAALPGRPIRLSPASSVML